MEGADWGMGDGAEAGREEGRDEGGGFGEDHALGFWKKVVMAGLLGSLSLWMGSV